jgi:serine/threonine-protein kinase
MMATHPDGRTHASECLDDETLSAFLEGRLAPSLVTRIDGHAASCAACRELLAASAKVAGDSVAARVGASVLLSPGPGKRQGRIGTTLKEKWRLDALVGTGGMAEVYSGTHRNGKRVAIKILLPQLAVDPELCRRFVQEGYIANQIGHSGVVSVHDDDVTDEGAPFLVMDLLEGECISDMIARGRMPIAESVRITRALLDILAAAHAKSVLHRDVKPGNIFRTTAGEVRLLDFGIARLADSGNTNATVTGATMGTPAYMPPEQARGIMREVDARSDVWATGAVLFSMLTGTKVRDGQSNNEILILAATQPVRPIRETAPWVPAPLAAIIDRALSFAKTDRFGSASEMAAAIDALPPDALRDLGTEATVMFQPRTVVPSTVAEPPPFTMMGSATSVPPTGPSFSYPQPTSNGAKAKQIAIVAAGGVAALAAMIGVTSTLFSSSHRAPTVAPPTVVSALPPAATTLPPKVEPPAVTTPPVVATGAPTLEEPTPKPAAAEVKPAPKSTVTPSTKPKSAPTVAATAGRTSATPPSPVKSSAPDPYDRRL